MTDHPAQFAHAWLDAAAFAVNLLLLPLVLGLAAFVALPAAACYLLCWWCRPRPSARLAGPASRAA